MPPVAVCSHLALAVSDLDLMRDFYVGAFGFVPGTPYTSAGRRSAELMGTTPAGFAGLFLRSGDMLIELLAHIDGSAPATTPRVAAEYGYAHLSFAVEDIDATIVSVREHGGSFHTRLDHRFDPADPRQTKIVFVLDPDGNRIELIEHPSGDQIQAHARYLGLADIGWPAVEALARSRAPVDSA